MLCGQATEESGCICYNPSDASKTQKFNMARVGCSVYADSPMSICTGDCGNTEVNFDNIDQCCPPKLDKNTPGVESDMVGWNCNPTCETWEDAGSNDFMDLIKWLGNEFNPNNIWIVVGAISVVIVLIIILVAVWHHHS